MAPKADPQALWTTHPPVHYERQPTLMSLQTGVFMDYRSLFVRVHDDEIQPTAEYLQQCWYRLEQIERVVRERAWQGAAQ